MVCLLDFCFVFHSARMKFAQGHSDLLTDLKAFQSWRQLRIEGASSSTIRDFCESHFLSASALRDVQSTRVELAGNLQEIGFVPHGALKAILSSSGSKGTKGNRPGQRGIEDASEGTWDAEATNLDLIRSIVAASLWPSIIRVSLPSQKFEASAAGSILRDHEAKEVKLYDVSPIGTSAGVGRVFLLPSSCLFAATKYDSAYLASFSRMARKAAAPSSTAAPGTAGASGGEKIYLRDANLAPLLGLLLLAPGMIHFDHFHGGLEIRSLAPAPASTGGPSAQRRNQGQGQGRAQGQKQAQSPETKVIVRMRADARIGMLCNQLRRLLDAVLDDAIESPGRLLEPSSHGLLLAVGRLLQKA